MVDEFCKYVEWDWLSLLEFSTAEGLGYEDKCPELALLRSQLRGYGLKIDSTYEQGAEVVCRIIKEDLEALINAIRKKSTRKQMRDLTSDSGSEASDTDE